MLLVMVDDANGEVGACLALRQRPGCSFQWALELSLSQQLTPHNAWSR